MKNLDSLLTSSRPVSTPRPGSSARIMKAIHERPGHGQRLQLLRRLRPIRLGLASTALLGGAAFAYVDIQSHPDGLSARVAHRLGVSIGAKHEPEVPMPAVSAPLPLPDCDSGRLPCTVKSPGGGMTVAVSPDLLRSPTLMDRLGRSLSAATARDRNGVKILLYSSIDAATRYSHALTLFGDEQQAELAAIQNSYAGQFERMGTLDATSGGSLIRYISHPGAVPTTVDFEPTKLTMSASRVKLLTDNHLSYVGGEITAISADSITVRSKSMRLVHIDTKTQFLSSGGVRSDRNGLKIGEVVYALVRSNNGTEQALEVVRDAGIKNNDGGIEYDFYGVDFTPAEDAIIWRKR